MPCYRIYENETVQRLYPALVDSASLIGGTAIQGRASLGGNLCNASPAAEGETQALAVTDRIERLLVAGMGIDEAQAGAIVEETLASPSYALRPSDLRLAFPSAEIDFRQVAAPAGLAALAFG